MSGAPATGGGGDRWADATVVGGSSSTSKAERAASTPSIAEWNSDPALRSGAYTSGARTRIANAGSKSRSPLTTRSPTATAITATDIVATSSSTKADRNAILRVAIV